MFTKNWILTRSSMGGLLALLMWVGSVLTSRTCWHFLLRWGLMYLWELFANMSGVVQAIASFNFFLFYCRCESWIFFSNSGYRVSSKASIPIFRKRVFNLEWRRHATSCINGFLALAYHEIFWHVFETTLIQNWTSCFAHAKELLINWLYFFCPANEVAVVVDFCQIRMLFLFVDNIESKTWPSIVLVSAGSQSCRVTLILPRLVWTKFFNTDTILGCSHISEVDSRVIHRVSGTLTYTL